MTPKELRTLGEQHDFGWQSRLARSLGVTDRTVRRWLTGEHTISPEMEEIIRQKLAKRPPL